MSENNVNFKPIRQTRMLDEIIDQIKQNIANGQLSKGDRLPSERQMEQIFGVSRTTIREAIKSLELMGLVECIQGDGNYIAKSMDNSLTQPLSLMFLLEHGTLAQVQQLRSAMELSTAKAAAKVIQPQQLQKLESICTEMEQNLPESELAQIDKRFHYEIAQIAGNPLIIVLLNAIESLIVEEIVDVRESMLQQPGSLDRIKSQHRDILNALKSGDPEASANAMTAHMSFVETFTPE